MGSGITLLGVAKCQHDTLPISLKDANSLHEVGELCWVSDYRYQQCTYKDLWGLTEKDWSVVGNEIPVTLVSPELDRETTGITS